jgi:hypothetical protein
VSRYTPGPGGYALGVVVSVLVLPGVFAVLGLAAGEGPVDAGELFAAWPVLAAWAAIPASGVSAAIGRAAVIPLVRRRSGRLASAPRVRVP